MVHAFIPPSRRHFNILKQDARRKMLPRFIGACFSSKPRDPASTEDTPAPVAIPDTPDVEQEVVEEPEFPMSKVVTDAGLTMLITQLPTMISAEDQPKTFVSFWRMVADNRPEFLVQIGNCVERGYPQYPMYYSPGDGAMLGVGDTFVTTLEEEPILDGFVMKRLLKVEIGEETSITVTHYQYIDWNEWDVPRTPFVVVDLLNLVNKSEHPVIVYCSKGSGRSSTFAATEFFTLRLKTAPVVHAAIFRADMKALGLGGITTTAQQLFIELAVCFVRPDFLEIQDAFGSISIALKLALLQIPERVKGFDQIASYYKNGYIIELLSKIRNLEVLRILTKGCKDEHCQCTGIEDHFNGSKAAMLYTLRDRPFKPVPREYEECKCRYPTSLNAETAVRLLDASGNRVWINASDVRTATGLVFRLTQAPMDGTNATKDPTIEDFWRMVLTGGSEYIVQLCAMREGTDFVCPSYFPEAGNGQLWGQHWVRTLEKTHILDGDVIWRKIEVKYLDDPEEEGRFHRASAPHIVHHLQYLKYEGKYPDGSIENIVELLDIVNKSTKPVIVMCKDGLDKSAAFVGIEYISRHVERAPFEDITVICSNVCAARRGAFVTREAFDVAVVGVLHMLVKSYGKTMDEFSEEFKVYEKLKRGEMM